MIRPIHVLLLISAFAPQIGGGEKQAERQARALAARGVKVTVLTRMPPEGAPAIEQRDGFQVIRFPGRGRWKSTLQMVCWIQRHHRQIDILHAHQANSPLVAALAARALTGIPVVCTPLTASPELDWMSASPSAVMRMRLASMREVTWISISDTISAALQPHFNNVHEIPNGVDTDYFRPGTPQIPLQVVSVCRLDWPKRVDLLIDAWSDDWGAELMVVGDGPNREALERRVRERQLSSVRFLGAVSDVSKILAQAKIYAHSSDIEGMPNALMEAMSVGLCCLGSGVGQIPDMLSGGVGQVVPNDVPSWHGALQAALGDPQRCLMQGQAARERMIERYGLEQVVTRLNGVYLNMVRRI